MPTLNSSKGNTTLYKYRSWNNNFHRAILIHNKLYVPSITELNDPFDFQLKLDFSLLNDESKIDKFLDCSIQGYLDSLGNEINTQEMMLRLDEEKNKKKFLIKNNPRGFAKKYCELILEKYNNHYGILCLSKNWNNILMWTHYGDNHSGFCIGFNEKKLLESGFFGAGGLVDYKEEYPSIDPNKWNENDLNTLFKESHIKSIDWEYEEEYRFVKLGLPEILTPKERIYSFESDIIDEVIIGLNISTDNEKEIRDLCKEKRISVVKVKKPDYKFVLERE